jgi:hypothetical protein
MNAPFRTEPEPPFPHTLHAVYSPSSAHRWMECTASATAIAAMQRVIPDEDSEASEDGTDAHDELERVLGALNGEFVDPATMPILEVDRDHPAAFGVALMISYIRKLPPGQMWVEQRVRLTDQVWGRADIQHWHEESATLTIPDLKNGFVGVDAEENEQTRIYAAGSIATHGLPAKWIRHAIVQPNDYRPVPRVKQWVEPVETLREFAAHAAAIPGGPLTFKFGAHCRDCPLLGTCEPTRDVLAQFTTAVATGAAATGAQIPLFLAVKKPIDHFFEGLQKRGLKTEMARSGSVPGMKIVTAIKQWAWLSEDAARDAVVSAKGIAALSPPTPAQAEAMGIDVAGLVYKPQGGPVLAYESDKRPVWSPKSSADMFAGIPGLTGGGK